MNQKYLICVVSMSFVMLTSIYTVEQQRTQQYVLLLTDKGALSLTQSAYRALIHPDLSSIQDISCKMHSKENFPIYRGRISPCNTIIRAYQQYEPRCRIKFQGISLHLKDAEKYLTHMRAQYEEAKKKEQR